MKNKCIVKNVVFKNFIQESDATVFNMCLRMQLRSATVLKKWPVFLQNTSGNPNPN